MDLHSSTQPSPQPACKAYKPSAPTDWGICGGDNRFTAFRGNIRRAEYNLPQANQSRIMNHKYM
jgi:hypothetical protein